MRGEITILVMLNNDLLCKKDVFSALNKLPLNSPFKAWQKMICEALAPSLMRSLSQNPEIAFYFS